MAIESAEIPREAQIALSYLDDVKSVIQRISAESSVLACERLAEKALKGDIKHAKSELETLERQGIDVRAALGDVYFAEGNLCFEVANGAYGPEHRKKWMPRALNAYEKSVSLEPDAAA